LQDTPLQARILDKKELRKLASDGCLNLSFEFEATTDREEEEGSSGALKSLAANIVARSSHFATMLQACCRHPAVPQP
jgi:hypothetical protein